MDTSKIGQTSGLTLAQALGMLIDHAGQPVALIIDEAQHAPDQRSWRSSHDRAPVGARPTQQPGKTNLMIVMSAGSRQALRLVNTSGAAFFGSQIQRMPPLGADFIAHIATLIEAQRTDLAPVDQAKLTQAFAAFRSSAPVLHVGAWPAPARCARVTNPLKTPCSKHQQRRCSRRRLKWNRLPRPQADRACRALAHLGSGQNFRPYDASAQAVLCREGQANLAPRWPRSALESLRDRSPALVWRSPAASMQSPMRRCMHGLPRAWPPAIRPPRSPTTSPWMTTSEL